MSGVLSALKRLLPSSDAGISVPAMDGVFKPNNRLETSPRVANLTGIDNLASYREGVVASSGPDLFSLSGSGGKFKSKKCDSFDADISFIAALPDERLAIGLIGQGVQIGVPGNWRSLALDAEMAGCMTAAVLLPDGRLAITVGSQTHSAADWKRDLMQHGKSGLVLALDLENGDAEIPTRELAFPSGIAVLADGAIAVAESWRHRVISISSTGVIKPLLEDLPAYPARLAASKDGGFWLALFAPRRQLFELVLREDEYRHEMMASIDPSEWVGPSLNASTTPDHPLQQGAVRQMGVLKPWAPTSSYGLVARCDAAMRPLDTWHSRADGSMHGITSICVTNQGVLAASKGSGTLLHLENAEAGDLT